MTINAGSQRLGRLDLVLYDDSVPRTVKNFCELLQDPETDKGFLNCSFHRIIRGFMAQGGDFTNGDGTGGRSIYGKTFADENFLHKHNRPGILSMANAGKDTNGSQFFLCFRATPHLDGKHVVFGRVTDGMAVVKKVESYGTAGGDPKAKIIISDCGQL